METEERKTDWQEEQAWERKGKKEKQSTEPQSAIVHCCFTVWQNFSLSLCRSHFPLALSSNLVLILSFPVCQFVKAPHHYCQKSHCSANTKATRTISHIQAHTLVLAAHSCWKRATFFSDLVLTLSSKLVPLESWVRQTSSVNSELESLIFLSDTFSPLSPPKNSLSLSSPDCVIVSLLFWCSYELVAVSTLTKTVDTIAVTICASWDISVPDRCMISLTFGSLHRTDICLKDHNTISSNLIGKEGHERMRENIQDHLTAGFDEKLKPEASQCHRGRWLNPVIKSYTTFSSHRKRLESSDYHRWHSTPSISSPVRGC